MSGLVQSQDRDTPAARATDSKVTAVPAASSSQIARMALLRVSSCRWLAAAIRCAVLSACICRLGFFGVRLGLEPRAALAAALALAPAPGGFTAAEFTAKARHLTRHNVYTTRQAAYDLKKLRGKGLTDKPGRTRRYHVPPDAARTIAALLALRDHVIAPILAGVRSPRMGRKPTIWTPIDRDYETLRIDMQTLFQHVRIEAAPAAA